jgi:uncharacterized membrane protein
MNDKHVRQLIRAAIVLSIIGIALLIFGIVYMVHLGKQFDQYRRAVNTQPVSVTQTEQGPRGEQGLQGLSIVGPVGPKGDKGDTAIQTVTNKIVETNTVVEKQLPPEKGDKGDAGEPGQPGREIELHINPLTQLFEYRYIGDSRWTEVEGQHVAL